MGHPKTAGRRHFTAAARAAALEARRVKRELAVPLDVAEVFVVRSAASPTRFAWEIRRFGAVVLSQGRDLHACPEAARTAGLAALGAAGRPVGGAP